ncbi:ABC transporter ATP-binding protein [Brevibacillus sp. TJ4]|uniref:ABC transporter ATP-binding protein n=1 Tax=Brevibacillus sp. TJ4 TaxID=3234853 RepID=UPI003B9EC677
MEIKEITFSYDNKRDHVKKVSSRIESGKITTIIGPNGCGKSTLLGVISNNYSPRHGHVLVDGKQISQFTPKEFAKKVAVVHQNNETAADITVEKLVSFGRFPHKSMFAQNREEDERAIEWALTSTNLQAKRRVPIDQLSGGERQRAWIAMAIAQNTPFLFLDEPTTFLDMYYQLEILDLIKQLNEEHGLTIVMVLHDMNQAIRYSDRIIAMKNGEVVLEGEPNEAITAATIKEIYGVDVIVKRDEDTGLYIVPVGIS